MHSSLSTINNRIHSTSSQQKIKSVRILFFSLLFIWCLGFSFPVLTPSFEGKTLIKPIIAHSYSLVCNQSHTANIFSENSHLLVCARCAGIYIGALIAITLLLMSSLRINLKIKSLFALSAPLVIDALSVRIGLYPYSKIVAMITGVLFGGAMLLYILNTIENSILMQNNKSHDS
ncbi:MAG: DUF2085 domain-containing protein [Ignavibacteria bacterium]|jgi:uncharacterized membrane protein